MANNISARRLAWLSLLALPALAGLLGGRAESPASGQKEPEPRPRRPVALALADDGARLFVANRGSGTVSVLDAKEGKLLGEISVGRKLADLIVTPDGRRLLAVDEEAHELIVLARDGDRLKPLHRLRVSPFPVSVRVAPDGARCHVASLWSRRLTTVDLAPTRDGKAPRVAHSIPLPFAPREQLILPGGKRLVVADSFGGGLAVVDVTRGAVESVRNLPAHNVRGLALAPGGKELLIAHQTLYAPAPATRDNIHWGNLLTNNVRALSLAAVRKPSADLLDGSTLHHLDDVTKGAADPAGLAVAADGTIVVSLGGVGAVMINPHKADGRRRVRVGARPTAVALSPDGRRAYVANTFADSVSVIDVKRGEVLKEISLGERPKPSLADEGELLFHDARLSHDGWLSCHSCHTDGHTSGRLSDTLGDGTHGTPKRTPSLLGVKDTAPHAWNGSMESLEAQVRKSILTTMHGPKPADEQVKALSAYLRTLKSPPAPGSFDESPDREALKRGRAVFEKHACGNCHTPPAYTSARVYEVGLSDERGNDCFNPPSLRGVSQSGPYFHDGRAATLEEVFTRQRHQLKGELTKRELADLLTFLRGL